MVRTQAYLKSIIKKLTWVKPTASLPFSQGYSLGYLVKNYKIPAKMVGYSGGTSAIGIETMKQYLFWKDTGTTLEFLGIVNKSSMKKSSSTRKKVSKKKVRK